MTLLPDSIRTRTVLTLLVGLTASHLASIALYSQTGMHMMGMETGAWSHGSIASTLVMVVAIVVFSWWASGWITQPLSNFAHASEQLGMDVNAPPLDENGPDEVRAAARSFNQMQTRIRTFIEDRLRMLAAIAHDLRGPITRLKLRIEQIDLEPNAQAKMLADLDEMAQMVESSLAFARDEATDEASQPVDLAALIETICDDAADAGRKAEFLWEGRLVYQGRPFAMKRLFANLIDNGLRFGGKVTVSASNAPETLQVFIDDRGPGIPESERENVFRPFFRLEKSRNKRTGGIGLGLATARSIARAHGGDVILANRPEGGLRATVTLPRRSNVGS
jgi:signal transduction histidine kinase